MAEDSVSNLPKDLSERLLLWLMINQLELKRYFPNEIVHRIGVILLLCNPCNAEERQLYIKEYRGSNLSIEKVNEIYYRPIHFYIFYYDMVELLPHDPLVFKNVMALLKSGKPGEPRQLSEDEMSALDKPHRKAVRSLKQLLYIDMDQNNPNTVCEDAIKRGARKCLCWLIKFGFEKTSTAYVRVIEYNHFDLLEILYRNNFPTDKKIFVSAVTKAGKDTSVDKFRYMQWLYDHNFPLTESSMTEAIRMGDLEIVQKLIDFDIPRTYHYCINAVYHNQFSILELFLKNNFPFGSSAISHAITHNRVSCFNFLLPLKASRGAGMIELAAQYGRSEFLQKLIDAEYPRWGRPCYYAAYNNHLDCLDVLLRNDFPVDQESLEEAAENGFFECLQKLLTREHPVSVSVCILAAREGHLNCLKLLEQFDFPFNTRVLDEAVDNHYEDCADFIRGILNRDNLWDQEPEDSTFDDDFDDNNNFDDDFYAHGVDYNHLSEEEGYSDVE